MKLYTFAMILFASPAFGADFIIPQTMGAVKIFDTPLAVAEHVIDTIGTNKYDKIKSSYFPKEITVKADNTYKECMFFAIKLIATMEYTTVSSADIANIKQRAFDSLCIIKDPDIQNRDWYYLIFNECMTTDNIHYRHFSAEKYQELENIKTEYYNLLHQQYYNAITDGTPITEPTESIDTLKAKIEKAKQDFFVKNTSTTYSNNNKNLWCDCIVSAIFPEIKDYDDLNNFPSDSKIRKNLHQDEIDWNINAHKCYTKLTKIYDTNTK